MQHMAKSELKQMVKAEVDKAGEEPEMVISSEPLDNLDNLAYYQERFPNFAATLVDTDTQQLQSQPSNTSLVESNPENVVEEYFAFVQSMDLRRKQPFDIQNPMDFWLKYEKNFRYLALLAQDILAIPASTAFVERCFSAAGITSSGRRAAIGPLSLENEVLLKVNKHIVM